MSKNKIGWCPIFELENWIFQEKWTGFNRLNERYKHTESIYANTNKKCNFYRCILALIINTFRVSVNDYDK